MAILDFINIVDKLVMAADEEAIVLPGFSMKDQEEDNWCWVAVTIASADYVGSLKISNQCEAVKKVKKSELCRDVCGSIKAAFEVQGIFPNVKINSPDIGTIASQLGAQRPRPVVCRVRRSPDEEDPPPHAVVIVSCSPSDCPPISCKIGIEDPSSEDKYWEEVKFLGYLEGGRCLNYYIIP